MFSIFNDNNVSLYIGAHMHQYERLYPYYEGKFSKKESPYENEEGLVSIVEAAAPNELGLVEIWYPKLYFSVTNTHNVTGFGLLKSHLQGETNNIVYEHYKTTSFTEAFDKVEIIRTF